MLNQDPLARKQITPSLGQWSLIKVTRPASALVRPLITPERGGGLSRFLSFEGVPFSFSSSPAVGLSAGAGLTLGFVRHGLDPLDQFDGRCPVIPPVVLVLILQLPVGDQLGP